MYLYEDGKHYNISGKDIVKMQHLLEDAISEHRNEFKRLLAYIINEFYQNDENIQCNYGCSVIESDHQTMQLQVRSNTFGIYPYYNS